MLQHQIEGCRWLDLCSGAGTMGAEALSRGARFVLGIECSRQACEITRSNWQRLVKPDQSFQILRADVASIGHKLSAKDTFDVIYFDPPYRSTLYGTVLPLLPAFVAPHGWLFVEHLRKEDLPAQINKLQRVDQRTYGQTALSIYRYMDTQTSEPAGS
jgi:16S rRNA (guanine(966)-N(2))-methyltransferase RsmD